MPNLYNRIVILLLVPCLVAEPGWAQKIQSSFVRNAAPETSDVFDNQALANPAVPFTHRALISTLFSTWTKTLDSVSNSAPARLIMNRKMLARVTRRQTFHLIKNDFRAGRMTEAKMEQLSDLLSKNNPAVIALLMLSSIFMTLEVPSFVLSVGNPYLLLREAIFDGSFWLTLYALLWCVAHPLLATWQVYGFKSKVKFRPLFILVNLLPGAFLSPLIWLYFQAEGGGRILLIYARHQFQKVTFNLIPAFGLGVKYLMDQHQFWDRGGWETLLASLLISGVSAGLWRLTLGRWIAWVGRLAFAAPLALYHFLPTVIHLGPYIISTANPAFSQPFLWISVFHFVPLRNILSLFMGTSATNRWAHRWAAYPSDGDLLINEMKEWVKSGWHRDGQRDSSNLAAEMGLSTNKIRTQLAGLPPSIFNQLEWERDLSIDSSIRIGHVTAAYAAPKSLKDLQTILQFTYEHNIPRYVLGGATNVLIADRVEGLVISLKYFSQFSVDSKRGFVEAQAGVPLRQLVESTADAGLAGLEFGYGIPGTLGGALCTAATYPKSHFERTMQENGIPVDTVNDRIETVVEKVTALRPDGTRVTLKPAELEFGYRTSIFQKPPFLVVYRARLKLKRADPATIWRVINILKSVRRKSRRGGEQPIPDIVVTRSIGRAFRDQDESYRGRKASDYIIEAGAADWAEGPIRQIIGLPGALYNVGQGTTEQYLKLVRRIQAAVRDMFDVQLLLLPRIIPTDAFIESHHKGDASLPERIARAA